MKKGTAVKFIGTENRQPVEKTYIWAVTKISETENVYLIEHPEGTLLNDETKKDFEGFDITKLHHGKRYLVAYENELIGESKEEIINTKEENVKSVPLIKVEMPKEYFEQVKDFMQSQKEQCQSNPLVKMQLGPDFDGMIAFFDEMIQASDNALKQDQHFETKENEGSIVVDKTTNATPIPVFEQPTSNN